MATEDPVIHRNLSPSPPDPREDASDRPGSEHEYISIIMDKTAYNVKHPLNSAWTLWFDTPGQKRASTANWQQNLKKLITFDTVEDFWGVWNNVMKVSEVPPGSNYHLFRKGVQPAWEDPANGNGGKWTIPVKKKPELDGIWLNTVLAMIGESFDPSTEICGAVASVRARGDRVALWTRTGSDKESQEKIGKQLKQFCNLPAAEPLGYLIHHDTSKNPQDVYKA